MSVAEDRIVRRLDISIEKLTEISDNIEKMSDGFARMSETLLEIGMNVRQASDTLERMEKQR